MHIVSCIFEKLVTRGGVVVCWTAKWEVWGSDPDQCRNLDLDFCSTLFHLWDHKSVTPAVTIT